MSEVIIMEKKERYESVEMNIIAFDIQDVITTSSNSNDGWPEEGI